MPRAARDMPRQAVRGNVLTVLEQKDQREVKAALLKDLDLEQVGGVTCVTAVRQVCDAWRLECRGERCRRCACQPWAYCEAHRPPPAAPSPACMAPPAQVTDRNVENLSGGELQRFAIAVVACQQASGAGGAGSAGGGGGAQRGRAQRALLRST
jgi:hypothetical protein